MANRSYPVFLSYNSEDRDAVEKIAIYLADNAKLHPWFDQWDPIPGESAIETLDRGLAASATCAVFVGKSGEGPWQKREIETALRRQIYDRNFRVIPVLLPNAPQKPKLPSFLVGNVWVEFHDSLEDDDALWRLECGIQGVSPGRGRPNSRRQTAATSQSTKNKKIEEKHVVLNTNQDQPADTQKKTRTGLPSELNKKIVDFLTSIPNIHDVNSQRALIYGAGLDSQLQNQIHFSGPPAQFFQLLISTLVSYGTLEDGRDALEAILEAAKNHVGRDRREYCDILIQELRKPRQKSSKLARIFICYHHQKPDISLAHNFANALKQAGHHVFIDTNIRWGMNWGKKIQEELGKSNYFLLLLSQEAAKSEQIAEEVAVAKELGLIILPVRVCFPFTGPLPYPLSIFLDSIRQVAWNGPDDTSHLVQQLLGIIANQTSLPAETLPEVIPNNIPHVIQIPQPQIDPRPYLTPPGGAIPVDSPLYIERKVDKKVSNIVRESRAIVTIQGPRQTGKTSLVMRVYAGIRRAEKSRLRVAFVDLQAISPKHLQSLNAIWRAITARIARQLQVKSWNTTDWREDVEYDENISQFLEHGIFEQNENPILFCFDEIDRVFQTTKSAFFASIRAFYNRGAIDPIWENVRWLLITSSEPRFFIEDLSQSPFNICESVRLSTFTFKEVSTFARRYGLILTSHEIDKIMKYVGGHPYLVHLLLYHLVHSPKSRDKLFDAQTAGDGIFRDHLHRYLIHFQQDEQLAEAMRNIIHGKGCEDVRIANRLEAAGLVRRNEEDKLVPLCGVYKEFFGKKLQ